MTCEYPINLYTNPNPVYKSLKYVTKLRQEGISIGHSLEFLQPFHAFCNIKGKYENKYIIYSYIQRRTNRGVTCRL
jgi:hypothetical protein